MRATTLTRDTMTPMLPFDFDGQSAALVEEEARKADRELCQRYLGTWADTYGSEKRQEPVTFAEFMAAAARLGESANGASISR